GINIPGVHIGDLSATLIRRINPLANYVRIPDKKTALLPDWETKLPALVAAAKDADVSNISGVPSWFLTVIRKIMEAKGAEKISDVWPNLEVFFHGGISFEPYRDEYKRITDPKKMHFLETYNASEGFFAVQNDFKDKSMLLIIDRDIFYEFIPVDGDDPTPRTIWEVNTGDVYELVISSSNGLWRYHLGDTVRVTQTSPVKIRIAGRTKSFINAFGEELMEDNAERAIATACDRCGASILNYTAAPLFASRGRKGRHQWVIEWGTPPANVEEFAAVLDAELRRLNSDYDAKRSKSIFLDGPQIITARRGLFDDWLRSAGSHKLGGQRKVPRLSNDRALIERLLQLQ
ncbi:MAG: GH3 auxin-responsive promoter family protein, partial [Muribaculaceae bacterium]|nr:GH3 auxin-responsive promoter family protein [Muribaculaceae bacterium]